MASVLGWRLNPCPAMTRVEFAAELERLRRSHVQAEPNPGSYRSDDCERCIACMFCRACQDCYRCTHCQDCRATTGSSHCLRCVGCHDCSHCEDSENCSRSAYLVECSDCTDCTYCYGCVGLSKKEFHILNVGYPRTEYFARIKQLQQGR
jgi:hypothetical protein